MFWGLLGWSDWGITRQLSSTLERLHPMIRHILSIRVHRHQHQEKFRASGPLTLWSLTARGIAAMPTEEMASEDKQRMESYPWEMGKDT